MRVELPGAYCGKAHTGRRGPFGCSSTMLCGCAILAVVFLSGNYILAQRRNCDVALTAAQEVGTEAWPTGSSAQLAAAPAPHHVPAACPEI
jgi:uncharacterized iron-regulated membrane protein